MPNLKYEEAADRCNLPLFTYGDLVMCAQHDKPLMVVRVGWHGEPSPYYGDHEWKAWCESVFWDKGDHFADWLPLTSLAVVGRAEAARYGRGVPTARSRKNGLILSHDGRLTGR